MPTLSPQRALFLSPSYDHNEYRAAESLGLRSVAAVLAQKGVRVDVVDECSLPLRREIRESAAASSLIGIGALFTRQVPDALDLARSLRSAAPRSHIILGGQGSAFIWQRIMVDCDEIDSVCLHEGDETIGELWDCLQAGTPPLRVSGLCTRAGGKVHSTPFRPPAEDIDRFPFPYRSMRADAYRDGHAMVSTSRGCAAHCTFCQSGNYGNRYHKLARWRFRSAERISQEITELVTRHQVKAISFVDDDFLGGDGQGRERALYLARLLVREPYVIRFSIECRINELDKEILQALWRVGLRHVLIGIESANENDIRLFAKKTTCEQAEWAVALLRDRAISKSAGDCRV